MSEMNGTSRNGPVVHAVSPREIVNWIFITTIILSPLLSYSLPEKAVSAWPWARGLVEFLARLVPSIDKIAAISTFPDATRMFLSIQWSVIAPIYVVLFGKYYTVTPAGIAMIRPILRQWHLWLLPFALVAALFASLSLPLSGPPPYVSNTPIVSVIRLMGESRFWLGIFGSAQAMVTAFVFVALFRLPSLYRQISTDQNISTITHRSDK